MTPGSSCTTSKGSALVGHSSLWWASLDGEAMMLNPPENLEINELSPWKLLEWLCRSRLERWDTIDGVLP